MGITRSVSISLASCALIGLAGCKADVVKISKKIPAGFHGAEFSSRESRLTCQRATYVVKAAEEAVVSTFAPLDSLYSSSFLACVTGEERDFWGQAAINGKVLWRVDRNTEEWHYWYQTGSKRLLVMQLGI